MRNRANELVLIGLFLVTVTGISSAQRPVEPLATQASEIVRRLGQHDLERQALLERYGSERTYRIEYHGPMGDRSAELQARMDFSAPDQKHFTVVSETGSAMFCHKVLDRLMESEQEGALEPNHLRTMLTEKNDNFRLMGEDDVDGVRAWVLEVSPKLDSKFNYKGKVWVSMDDYAVVRIVGSPAKSPSWIAGKATFDYRYAPYGRFWLPQRSVTVSHPRLGGEVTLTVDYGTYDIVAAPANRSIAGVRDSRTTEVAASNVSLLSK